MRASDEELINAVESAGFSELTSIQPRSVESIIAQSGLLALTPSSTPDCRMIALRSLARNLQGEDKLSIFSARAEAIKHLEAIEVRAAAKLVDAALEPVLRQMTESGNSKQGEAVTCEEITPWPDVVNGFELLEEIRKSLDRYLVLPPHASIAIALWIFHTFLYELFDFTVYLLIHSPAPECGKSRLLDVIQPLVSRPIRASSFSPAAMYRAIEKYRPTVLIDEGDAFLNSEDLRGILNDGWSRSGRVYRCEGDDNELRGFAVYCPKAVAKIGRFEGKWKTVASRSIVLAMQRKKKEDKIERLRMLTWATEARNLRRKLLRWAGDHIEKLKDAEPLLPEELSDRAQDSWLPLLAIAETLGEEFGGQARKVAVALSGGTADADDYTPGEMLLSDIQSIFEGQEQAGRPDPDKIHSEDLCRALTEIEGHLWADWKDGKPISKNSLSRLLKPFGIRPKQMKIGDVNRNGYEKSFFTEAWARYLLHPSTEDGSSQKSTGSAAQQNQQLDGSPVTLPNAGGRISESATSHRKQREVESVEFRQGDLWDLQEAASPSRTGISDSVAEDDPKKEAWQDHDRAYFERLRRKRELGPAAAVQPDGDHNGDRRLDGHSVEWSERNCYPHHSIMKHWRRSGGVWQCAECHPPQEER